MYLMPKAYSFSLLLLMSGSTATNKRGQAKAKGVSQGHNIECEIYDNRSSFFKVY